MKRLAMISIACLFSCSPVSAFEITRPKSQDGIEAACVRAAELQFPDYGVDVSSLQTAVDPMGPDFDDRVLVSVEAYSHSSPREGLGVRCQFSAASPPYQLTDLYCRDLQCHVPNARFGKIAAILTAEGFR